MYTVEQVGLEPAGRPAAVLDCYQHRTEAGQPGRRLEMVSGSGGHGQFRQPLHLLVGALAYSGRWRAVLGSSIELRRVPRGYARDVGVIGYLP